MKLKSYSINLVGIKNICQSPSIWGCEDNTNNNLPLMYLIKPKWMSKLDFQYLVENIEINISPDKIFDERK